MFGCPLNRADSVFQSMKSSYGPAMCFMLPLNSRPDYVAQSMSSELPDPWCQFILGSSEGDAVAAPVGGGGGGGGGGGSETDSGIGIGPVEKAKDVLLLHDDSSFDGATPASAVPNQIQHPLAPSPSLPERLASLDHPGGGAELADLVSSPSLPQLHNGCPMQVGFGRRLQLLRAVPRHELVIFSFIL